MNKVELFEEQKRFFYACKKLKEKHMKLNFECVHCYEVLSRVDDSIITAFYKFDEFVKFCDGL